MTDSSGGTIDYLTVNTGALTVAGGAINYMHAESYAAAVNITGGTVTNFTLNEYEGEEVSAAVSGGSVQWIRMNGGALTVNGGDYRERMDLFAGGAKLSDKSELDRVKKLIDSLTENERAMLGKEALGKVDALTEKLQKLAKDASSPKTGDTSNPAMWIALLFISDGVTVISKKKKRFVK